MPVNVSWISRPSERKHESVVYPIHVYFCRLYCDMCFSLFKCFLCNADLTDAEVPRSLQGNILAFHLLLIDNRLGSFVIWVS